MTEGVEIVEGKKGEGDHALVFARVLENTFAR